MTNEKTDDQTVTVLIADDDTSLLQAMCRRMRKENFNLIFALDGYQAVQLARQNEPDIVVLDINMPAGDGFTVLERIQALPNLGGTPVVYITGERSEEVMTHVGEVGAHALLYKPFDTTDLVNVIKEAVQVD